MLHKVRIAGKQPEYFFREFCFGNIFKLELNGLYIVFIMQIDQQLLPGMQFDLACLAGERIRPVHPNDAADAVKNLTVNIDMGMNIHFTESIRQVTPSRHTGFVTVHGSEHGVRVGQRLTVVILFGAACPYSERRRIHHQLSSYRFYMGKMAGNVFTSIIIDGPLGDRVGAFTRIPLGAFGRYSDRKSIRQAVDQYITRTRQRRAVIQLAGALRHQRDSAGPGPVSVGRKGVFRIIDDTVRSIRAAGNGSDLVFGSIRGNLNAVVRPVLYIRLLACVSRLLRLKL